MKTHFMAFFFAGVFALLATWLYSTATPVHADSGRGKELFEKRCTGCHALDRDRVGPRLRGVFGRPAGSIPSFPYSEAVRNSGVVWDSSSLDKWLTDPNAFLSGTDMAFRLVNPDDRADIIGYLKDLSRD